MTGTDLVDRLAALANLAPIPRAELEWLVSHGRLESYPPGAVIAPKGQRIEKLWIVLTGRVGVRVDRGAGPRRVMGWHAGDVSGMLPYSRMTGPPGDNYSEAPTELFTIPESRFPEMIAQCPVFTAYAVHLMLDRARSFSASDLHDEKMVSLGKLAAGLAHELNNPASAAVRGAKALVDGLTTADKALGTLAAAGLTRDVFEAIDEARAACQPRSVEATASPLERADCEDELAEWLGDHGADAVHAVALADTTVTIDALDRLARAVPVGTIDVALAWITATCGMRAVAGSIEQASTRIYDLVAAVKRFTYMDQPAEPDFVDLEPGLRDTLRVLGSKTESKQATVTLDVAADLPRVRAAGVELNQVWFILIDNALDAVAASGRIVVTAGVEGDRVVVRVVDDGPGIPEDVLPRVFDAFFTTKPPGQGTGLGLDIARRLVRRYHGDIAVQSVPGRTAFVVSLSIEPPRAVAADERPARQE